jgi:hypothetical protein
MIYCWGVLLIVIKSVLPFYLASIARLGPLLHVDSTLVELPRDRSSFAFSLSTWLNISRCHGHHEYQTMAPSTGQGSSIPPQRLQRRGFDI